MPRNTCSQPLVFFQITPIIDAASPNYMYLNQRPFPRSGHRVASDGMNLYVVGGYNPDYNGEREIFREIWRFNLASHRWCRLKAAKDDIPDEWASHSVSLVCDDTLLIYGGSGYPFGAIHNNRTFAFNIKTNQLVELEPKGILPQSGYGHALCLYDDVLFVYGGTTGWLYNSDVFAFNLTTLTWELFYVLDDMAPSDYDEAIPNPRYRHEVCLYKRSSMLVFGGGTAACSEPLDVLPCLDLIERKWHRIRTKPDPDCVPGYPEPRRCHSVVLYNNSAYICGGYNGHEAFNDLWSLNLDTLVWHCMDAKLPKATHFHSAAVTQAGLMLVYGGVTNINDQERTSDIFAIWLAIPTLAQLAWEAVLCSLRRSEKLLTFSNDELKALFFGLGVPRKYARGFLFR